jgi:hypothetical protein
MPTALRCESRALDSNGDLRVEMAGGSLTLKLPEVDQEGSTGRKRIGSGYALRAGNEVVFHLGAYDKAQPLVIDPTPVYATYFGSSHPTVQAVAVDTSGNAYMGGYTNNNFIPSLNAVQSGMLGQTNAFISKFDPTGKTLLYSTYLGGSGYDQLTGISVDSTTGNLVGAGRTTSPDFPLVNPAQAALGTTASAFSFRLNATGSGLVYSTYLGGPGYAVGNDVALDASSNAYVTGIATSFQSTSGTVTTAAHLSKSCRLRAAKFMARNSGATGAMQSPWIRSGQPMLPDTAQTARSLVIRPEPRRPTRAARTVSWQDSAPPQLH